MQVLIQIVTSKGVGNFTVMKLTIGTVYSYIWLIVMMRMVSAVNRMMGAI